LNLDDIVEANHVSSQIRELCTLQFRNLESVVLLKPWLLTPDMKGRSFSVDFLDRTTDVKPKERIEFGRKKEEQSTHGLNARATHGRA